MQQENLDLGTAGLAAIEPRRNNPAVVGHQQIARPEILANVTKDAVLDLAGLALHDQQTRGIPRLDRRLCDAFGGEEVVEVGGFHGDRGKT